MGRTEARIERQRMVDVVRQSISEKDFQKWVLEAFQGHPNIFLIRRNTGAVKIDDKRFVRFGYKGASDLEGIIKSYHCPRCGCMCERYIERN